MFIQHLNLWFRGGVCALYGTGRNWSTVQGVLRNAHDAKKQSTKKNRRRMATRSRARNRKG